MSTRELQRKSPAKTPAKGASSRRIPTADAKVPQRIGTFGQYTLRSKLGEGGLGVVYLAENEKGDRFALKILKSSANPTAQQTERFQREMRLALRLKHPHIVATHDVGVDGNGVMYLLMEYCAGGSLFRWKTIQPPMTAAQAITWMSQAADALDYAFRNHQLVHRDIKPSNLMLDDGERLKLADFGLARRTTDDATRCTVEGAVLGSALYMSPEQALGKTVDIRSDLYSLGATFYHLLAQVPLFPLDGLVQMLRKQVNEQPILLSRHRPDLPKELVAIIHDLLAKSPDDRIQHPSALHARLRAFTQPKTTPVRTRPSAPKATRQSAEAIDVHRLRKGVALWPEAKAWLKIFEPGTGGEWDVAVYAQAPLRFGRAIDGGVDLPLRLYPVSERRAESMKISSAHGQFDVTVSGWTIQDLGSRNGLQVNGQPLPGSEPVTLPSQSTVEIPDAIRLECFGIAQDVKPAVRVDGCLLPDTASSSLAILRTGNRPDLAAVLMRGRLLIGGGNPRRGLVLSGMSAGRCGTLWWLDRTFWWQPMERAELFGRSVEPETLAPLRPDDAWSTGSLQLSIRRFSFDLFR